MSKETVKEITVRFHTLLREIVGKDCICLEAEDLGDAVKQLELEFVSRFQEQLVEYGIGRIFPLQDHCLLLLNGRSVNRQELSQIELDKGNILHVFLAVAGG